jgi:hypothetical protein
VLVRRIPVVFADPQYVVVQSEYPPHNAHGPGQLLTPAAVALQPLSHVLPAHVVASQPLLVHEHVFVVHDVLQFFGHAPLPAPSSHSSPASTTPFPHTALPLHAPQLHVPVQVCVPPTPHDCVLAGAHAFSPAHSALVYVQDPALQICVMLPHFPHDVLAGVPLHGTGAQASQVHAIEQLRCCPGGQPLVSRLPLGHTPSPAHAAPAYVQPLALHVAVCVPRLQFPHAWVGAVPLHVQAPAAHTRPLLQAFPHVPQLFLSFCVFVGWPPQQALLLGRFVQLDVLTAVLQTWHAFARFDSSSEYWVPSMTHTGGVYVHSPLWQLYPLVHWCPQVPQLLLSVCVLTQAFPQHVFAPLHAVPVPVHVPQPFVDVIAVPHDTLLVAGQSGATGVLVQVALYQPGLWQVPT